VAGIYFTTEIHSLTDIVAQHNNTVLYRRLVCHCFHFCASTSVLARRGILRITLAIVDVSSQYHQIQIIFCYIGVLEVKVFCAFVGNI
jgi:hypothetical protein